MLTCVILSCVTSLLFQVRFVLSDLLKCQMSCAVQCLYCLKPTQSPTHLMHAQRATPMMFLVTQAPGSHFGMASKHPLELDNASCCNGRRAAPTAAGVASSKQLTSMQNGTAPRGISPATRPSFCCRNRFYFGQRVLMQVC